MSYQTEHHNIINTPLAKLLITTTFFVFFMR